MDEGLPVAADEKARAEFYRAPKQDKAATQLEGRPIYKMVDYVRICIPGDKDVVDRPVREDDKRRFRPQYAAFTADKPQDEATGTLLSAWAGLPPERVAEYQFLKVQTVEHLANVSDTNIQRMGAGALAERQRAKDYLESTKSQAPMLRLQAENTAMRSEMEALRNALKEQGDRLEAVATGKGLHLAPVRDVPAVSPEATTAPRKRGRPSKQKELS